MRLRAPDLDDAGGVFAVLCERDIADFGVVDCTLADVLDEWKAGDFDRGADARVCVEEDGRIVGYASVRLPGTYSSVSPRVQGSGADELLLRWSERRQKERGWERYRQAVGASNEPARKLLERTGYERVRSHFRMELALDGDLQAPGPPAGVSFRVPDPKADAETLYELDRASFAEVAEAQQESMEHFVGRHLGAHDLDAALSTVASRGAEAVGFLLARRWAEEDSGFVDILAVAPGEQGRGLGGALLRRAFAMFHCAGLGRAQLGVAADNPRALGLYERVGMTPRFQIDAYERAVD